MYWNMTRNRCYQHIAYYFSGREWKQKYIFFKMAAEFKSLKNFSAPRAETNTLHLPPSRTPQPSYYLKEAPFAVIYLYSTLQPYQPIGTRKFFLPNQRKCTSLEEVETKGKVSQRKIITIIWLCVSLRGTLECGCKQ
jgi:hypothetical protein